MSGKVKEKGFVDGDEGRILCFGGDEQSYKTGTCVVASLPV